MRQAEKALRDAGWEEVPVSEVREGDEVYDLKEHDTYVARIDGKPASIGRVLRAPRPEPEYEPGTVALVQPVGRRGPEVVMRTDNGSWWAVRDFYTPNEVEVLRVIAYPDGSRPTDQIESDRDELIEGMVPYIAEWGQMRTALGLSAPGWSKASEERKQRWKEGARIALREAYEEATK